MRGRGRRAKQAKYDVFKSTGMSVSTPVALACRGSRRRDNEGIEAFVLFGILRLLEGDLVGLSIDLN